MLGEHHLYLEGDIVSVGLKLSHVLKQLWGNPCLENIYIEGDVVPVGLRLSHVLK
jgi:hypothetical protein